MTAKRQAAERFGRRAETAAAWRLRLTGWRVLARRWRCAAGEIDLIARRGRVLAFVEVKARAGEHADVTPHQRRRIARAAEAFLAAHPELGRCRTRFDVVIARRLRPPRRIADAWRP